ncbi:alpha-amylase [Candidatus Woesearchaeota archaeon]|nr:alpha-amylase [Candidatus Woesearchaeota archaeon]
MVAICFYFQVHQPFRMRNYHVFDIGKDSNYFDEQKNKEIMEKVARKCYLPTTRLLLSMVREHKGKFRCSFSITGTALEQFERYSPEVISIFRELAETGCVEFLSETYHHSLSFLFSKKEFHEQVDMHRKKIEWLFGVTPKVFRNTELIFNNELAIELEKMGYKGVLAEGADQVLDWRSPNYLYKSVSAGIPLLLKNYKLSDDIAFRFSNPEWKEHPLTVPKYVHWLNQVNGAGEVVNLFMDYETFGEHQWEDKGIFQFLEHLPREFLKNHDNSFMTPSEVISSFPIRGELDIHHPVSWADVERDLSAWRGNPIQEAALKHLYEVEDSVKMSNDEKLISDWRKLTTSDHFYYMCTKWFNDGDVHKYFNPYDSPYDSFIAFMNVLKDMEHRININVDSTISQDKLENDNEVDKTMMVNEVS